MTDLPDSALQFIREACSMLPGHAFSVRLWDGRLIEPEGETSTFTLVLRHPEVMSRMLAVADWRTLGEAYMRDEIDIEGDMERVYPVAELMQRRRDEAVGRPDAGDGLTPFASQGPAHTRTRDAEAIEYHYDQSNQMFELVTDPTLSYSSACYYAQDDSLEQAQRNKMERACAKIGVKDGERVLDIGCGWGGVLSYVAERNKVQINGVTISKAQAEFARARMAREGKQASTSVEVCDYRDIDASEPYDKIISLGMVEHVGVANLPSYFEKAFRLLRPGGLFLMQGVSSFVTEDSTEGIEFTGAYLFPDADMPYLAQYVQAAQEAGFEVRDIENLREHYAWTHRAWRRNLEANKDDVIALVGRDRYRALRILYSYSTYYFLQRKCSVYQFALWRPGGDRPELPLRRSL